MNIKKNILPLALWCAALGASAQQTDPVLLVVDGKPILRSEFEYIYNKNKNLSSVEQKDVNDYFRLFTDFKLKVAEAERLGLDTLPEFRREYIGYRNQLSRNYLTDTLVDAEQARRYYDRIDSLNHVSAVKMKHVFFYLPQTVSQSVVRKKTIQMDSIYEQLKRSPEQFDELVERFSDDKRTLRIGYLQTPEDFENYVFALHDGEISVPFFSPQGIHIVKVLEHVPLPSFERMKDDLIYRISRVRGVSPGTRAVADRLKQEYGFAYSEEGYQELVTTGRTEKEIFILADQSYSGDDFAQFARMFRRPFREQLDLFVLKTVLDYEDGRLEEKYPEFRYLMQEYKEGMLLFERSNREVWQKAASDTVGLEAYFADHQKTYKWDPPHYKGVVMHSVDKGLYKEARRLLKDMPESEWADFLTEYFNADGVQRVAVDEGPFEIGDNPYVDQLVFRGPKVAPREGFGYVKVFGRKLKYPESYKEVKGELISDYQKFLEDLWISRLRSEIEVEINEEALKSVNKR